MRRRHQSFQPIGFPRILVSCEPGTGPARYIASTGDNRNCASGITPEAAVTTLFRRLAMQQAGEL